MPRTDTERLDALLATIKVAGDKVIIEGCSPIGPGPLCFFQCLVGGTSGTDNDDGRRAIDDALDQIAPPAPNPTPSPGD